MVNRKRLAIVALVVAMFLIAIPSTTPRVYGAAAACAQKCSIAILSPGGSLNANRNVNSSFIVSFAVFNFTLVQQKRDCDGDERIDVFFTASLPAGQCASIREPNHCDALEWATPTNAPGPIVGYLASALFNRADGQPKLAYWGFD